MLLVFICNAGPCDATSAQRWMHKRHGILAPDSLTGSVEIDYLYFEQE